MSIYTNIFLNLTIEGLVLFITFLVNLTIALVVFFKNPRKKVNVVFGAMIISVCLWNLTNFLSDTIRVWEISLAIGYWTLGTALFIPAFFLYFSKIFPKSRKLNKWELFYIFFPAIIMLFFIPSELNIISSTYYYTNWGTFFEAGILYLINAVHFIVYVSWALSNLIRSYFNARNKIVKTQIAYIVVSAGLAGFVGIITNAILPILGYHGGCVYGTPFSIIFGLCVAYSITRYRFMDIKVVLRKSFVYGLGILVLVGLVVGGGVLIEKILEIYFNISQALSVLLGLSFVVITFPSSKDYLKDRLNNIFQKDYIDLSKKFDEFEKYKFIANYRIENFCRELSEEIKRILNLSKIEFFVLDDRNKSFKRFFPKDDLEYFKKDNALVDILFKDEKIIIKEELSYLGDKKSKSLINFMNKYSLGFIIPLKFGGELIGILAGGNKLPGGNFTEDDINLFKYTQERTNVVLGQLRQRNNFLR